MTHFYILWEARYSGDKTPTLIETAYFILFSHTGRHPTDSPHIRQKQVCDFDHRRRRVGPKGRYLKRLDYWTIIVVLHRSINRQVLIRRTRIVDRLEVYIVAHSCPLDKLFICLRPRTRKSTPQISGQLDASTDEQHIFVEHIKWDFIVVILFYLMHFE